MPVKKSDVVLKVNGKDAKAYLVVPEHGGPGILLLHAWWGLKPFFKEVCDQIAGEGYVVLAPDMRDGQIARTVEEAEALHQKSDEKRTGDIVAAARDYLLALPSRTGGKIGVIGFSMGAQWALVTAAGVPEQVAAAVLFYGAGDADFSVMKARVMGHFSDIDEWESYDWVKQMASKMQAAGVDVTLHTYLGKQHWFVEEDRPEFDPESARLAWERTFAFLKSTL